jgi:hypothetical protein
MKTEGQCSTCVHRQGYRCDVRRTVFGDAFCHALNRRGTCREWEYWQVDTVPQLSDAQLEALRTPGLQGCHRKATLRSLAKLGLVVWQPSGVSTWHELTEKGKRILHVYDQGEAR